MNANSKLKAPLTIRKWLDAAHDELHAAGVPSPRLDAELLLSFVLDVDRTWLHAHSDDTFLPAASRRASTLVAQRVQRIPLPYLTGVREFYGRQFIVNSDVLIPRPESETIIDLAKAYKLTGRLLDVGCGSGALGLTLALELPVSLTMSDISHKTLAVARKNARALGIKPVRYVHSDLLTHWLSHDHPTPFDAVVANLPYVDESWERSPETNHEPALALFAGQHGFELIYTLLEQIPSLLRSGGYVLLEADPEQHEHIVTHALQNGLVLETVRDYIVVLRKP